VGLELHHLDGDNSNTVDENLAVLCVQDHDAHHRPKAYTHLKHTELGEDKLREYKSSWESFMAEASKPYPRVIAVVNVYGNYSNIHSARLILQWENGVIELERIYHLLTTGPVEAWIDNILDEIRWLGNNIQIVIVDEPLEVEYCPCCQTSLSNTIDQNMAKKITSEFWGTDSIGSIYINPENPSLAITISLKSELLYSGHLHLCGKFLHYICDNFEERVEVNHHSSIRIQATQIVGKVLDQWEPGAVFIGTGDPDNPYLISNVDLPRIWETRV
jgi:hypothetical protein